MGGKLTKLLKMLDPLDDTEENRFALFEPDDIKGFGPAAVLIELKGAQYWIPYGQLRAEGGELYATKWILDQKGIEL
jgi:hypothetical protein